jgi:hypothetical protein
VAENLRQVEIARREAKDTSADPDLDAVISAAGAIPFAGSELG